MFERGERTGPGKLSQRREEVREWNNITAYTKPVIEEKRKSFATLNYRRPGLGSWWSGRGRHEE